MSSKSAQAYRRMKAEKREGREHFDRVDAVHKDIAELESRAAMITREGITMGAHDELDEIAQELKKHGKRLEMLEEEEEKPLYVRKYSKATAYTAANRARNEASRRATNEFGAYKALALEQLTAAKKSTLPHEVMFLAQKLQAANRFAEAKKAKENAAAAAAAPAAAAAAEAPPRASAANAAMSWRAPRTAKAPSPPKASAANAAMSWRVTKKASPPRAAAAAAAAAPKAPSPPKKANAASSWRGTRKASPPAAAATHPARMPRDLDHLIHAHPAVYEHVSGSTFRIKFHNKNLRELARKETKREGEMARLVKERLIKAFEDTKKVTVRDVGEICEINIL